jgi:hypothetical protein
MMIVFATSIGPAVIFVDDPVQVRDFGDRISVTVY